MGNITQTFFFKETRGKMVVWLLLSAFVLNLLKMQSLRIRNNCIFSNLTIQPYCNTTI
jgi:hypothetical protein